VRVMLERTRHPWQCNETGTPLAVAGPTIQWAHSLLIRAVVTRPLENPTIPATDTFKSTDAHVEQCAQRGPRGVSSLGGLKVPVLLSSP